MTSIDVVKAIPLARPSYRRQLSLLRRILKEPQPVLDELTNELGPMFRLGARPMSLAVMGDPATVRELLNRPNSDFRWNHKFNVLGFVVGEGSMIVSDGDEHDRRRSSVQTAFSRRRLNSWMPMIVQRTDVAIDELTAGVNHPLEVDLYPFGRRLILDIVVRALFGERMAARAQEIGDLFQRPQDYLESSALRQVPHPLPFTARAKVRADRRGLDALIDSEIAARRADPSGDPTDVLETLVHDGSLSHAEVRDQVVTLIGAGYDTTSAALAWTLACIARHPTVWAQLRLEADAVFGAAGRSPSVDDKVLARLDVASRVMREALRLHPAGAISPREAAADMVVGGHSIKKGTLILWSAYLTGRDATAWPDPLRFNPDRFQDPTPEQKALADAAWVPFGRGARNCIGFALAQMELILVVARLAQRLDVEPITSAMPPPVGLVVNRPRGGVPVRVSRR